MHLSCGHGVGEDAFRPLPRQHLDLDAGGLQQREGGQGQHRIAEPARRYSQEPGGRRHQ